MVYWTLVRSNILEYGILDLGKVECTGIWYTRPRQGRIYWNMVYSTSVTSSVLEYGISDLDKVVRTGIWYIGSC